MKKYLVQAYFGARYLRTTSGGFAYEYLDMEDINSLKVMTCFYVFNERLFEFEIKNHKIISMDGSFMEIELENERFDYIYSFGLFNYLSFHMRSDEIVMDIILSDKIFYHNLLYPNQFPL